MRRPSRFGYGYLPRTRRRLSSRSRMSCPNCEGFLISEPASVRCVACGCRWEIFDAGDAGAPRAVSWPKLGTPGRDEASAQVARRPARDLNVEAVGSLRL
jgi:hypothetical protein